MLFIVAVLCLLLCFDGGGGDLARLFASGLSGLSCRYADRTFNRRCGRAVERCQHPASVPPPCRPFVVVVELSRHAPADDRRTWGRGMARACALCELCAHKKTPVSLGDCRGAVVDGGWWIVRSSIPFAELRLKADERSGVDDASVVLETQ